MKILSSPCDFWSNHSCWKSVVSELNQKWAVMMIPVEVMMCFFMVVGLFGNMLVLTIYSYRRQKSSANIFIMFLACIDLFTCIVLHPYIIYKLFHNYDQTWKETCKLFEYFNHCCLALSGMTLLLVAIDRYLAICRPVKFLLFDKHVVKAIASVSVIAVVASLPLFEFYGAAPYEVMEFGSNFTGFKCHYKVQYQNSVILTAFGAFIMCGFLTVIVTMVVLYKHVAVTAYKSRRTVMPLSNAHILAGVKPSVSSDTNTSLRRTNCCDNDKASCLSSSLNVISLEEMPHDYNRGAMAASRYSVMRDIPATSNRENITQSQGQDQYYQNSTQDNRRDKSELRNFSTRLKAAKILFFVTTVFFISWMPFLIMRICTTVNPNYWNDQSDTRYVIETFMNHVFYLNNAANPIIYTVINKNFRMDCKKVLKKHFGLSRS